jgi:hypothetical protein
MEGRRHLLVSNGKEASLGGAKPTSLQSLNHIPVLYVRSKLSKSLITKLTFPLAFRPYRFESETS